MNRKIGIVMMAAVWVTVGAQADTVVFGSGINQFSMDFVNIGNAGNAADTSTGFGAVANDYRIGIREVTLDQFAKARVADSRIGSGNEGYWNDGTRTVGTGGPASYVSANEAMKFSNWLTTGDAYTGAYRFDGDMLVAVDRDAAVSAYGTVYVLPTDDEWYKAAYYKPVGDGSYSLYASGLDTVPIHGTVSGWNYNNSGYVNRSPNYMWETGFGAEEQNGTFDMNGNVWEWNEGTWDGTLNNIGETRVIRGGAFHNPEFDLRSSTRPNHNPATEYNVFGFRVAAIPEPSSISMIGVASGFALFIRRMSRR